jgi:hypothetical protein
MSRLWSGRAGNCVDVRSMNVPSVPPCAPPWLIQMRFWSSLLSPPSEKTASQSPSPSTSPKSTFSDHELLFVASCGMSAVLFE